MDWPFDQEADVAALTTVGVLKHGLPILIVQHFVDDQEKHHNVIANGDGDYLELMLWIFVVFLGLLILIALSELLPHRRKQRRRRQLGINVRAIDPESVDRPRTGE